VRFEIDHVTVVVPEVAPAAAAIGRLLGAAPHAAVELPGMSIRSFAVGAAELHVNAPTGPGPVADHHRRHGAGYHHLALRVDDLDAAIAELAALGIPAAGPIVASAPGLREVFLAPHSVAGLWIQLVERRAATGEIDPGAVARLARQTEEA
jgi:methylmalonyl-CoA/ethylmalonyl-CoA epimerase